jgi:hypothetical protein
MVVLVMSNRAILRDVPLLGLSVESSIPPQDNVGHNRRVDEIPNIYRRCVGRHDGHLGVNLGPNGSIELD